MREDARPSSGKGEQGDAALRRAPGRPGTGALGEPPARDGAAPQPGAGEPCGDAAATAALGMALGGGVRGSGVLGRPPGATSGRCCHPCGPAPRRTLEGWELPLSRQEEGQDGQSAGALTCPLPSPRSACQTITTPAMGSQTPSTALLWSSSSSWCSSSWGWWGS